QRVPWAEVVAAEVDLGANEPSTGLTRAPHNVVATGKRVLQVSLGAGCAMPDRDPMPPPELAADAPVALFTQPVEVALGIARRMDLDAARGHRVHRLLREAGGSLRFV